MIRNIMLERAVDITMRDLRLNQLPDPTHELLKTEVCSRTFIIADCANVVKINLRPVNVTVWDMPTNPIDCVDRAEAINPAGSIDPGVSDNLMLVRVCVVVDPLFPTTGLALNLPRDGNGGYFLTSSSAFVNEPS